MLILTEIFIITCLIFLNGLLAMSEMAVVSSKRSKLKQLVAQGNKGAKLALKLSESSNDFLASIQIGITLIGVLAGAFSGATISTEISKFLTQFNPQIEPYSNAIGLGIVVIVVTYLSLIIGELVPKRLALNNPESIASRMSALVSFLSIMLKPLVYLLSFSTHFVLKILGSEQRNNQTITEEEVKFLIEEGAAAGVLDSQEENMMKRVLRLDDYMAEDLMTPRTKIIAIDINESLDVILEKIIQHSHSYLPIFNKILDRPIGILPVKIFLAKLAKNKNPSIKECLTETLFLPESIRADNALEKFRQSGKHLAFVVDEYGGLSGILTVHDITRSIMGEIPSSSQDNAREIIKREDGSFLVEGYMSFQDLMDYLDMKNDTDEDFQTVGGLMMVKLGKIPTEGESITLGDYKFEVVDMDRHRVDKILVSRNK